MSDLHRHAYHRMLQMSKADRAFAKRVAAAVAAAERKAGPKSMAHAVAQTKVQQRINQAVKAAGKDPKAQLAAARTTYNDPTVQSEMQAALARGKHAPGIEVAKRMYAQYFREHKMDIVDLVRRDLGL